MKRENEPVEPRDSGNFACDLVVQNDSAVHRWNQGMTLHFILPNVLKFGFIFSRHIDGMQH